MAQTIKNTKIANLYKHVYLCGVAISIAAQVIVTLVALLISSTLNIKEPMILVAAIVILELACALLILAIVLKPTSVLSRALSLVRGERSTLAPPNANNLHGLAKSELAACLTTIYEGQSNTASQTQTKHSASTESPADVLSQLPIGIITLDNTFNVVYSNSLAPVYTAENRRFIKLDFSTDTLSLQDWAINATKNAVSDSHVWARIQDAPAGSSENRHIYDVVASYQRGSHSGADITIVTIDRTNDYIDNENSIDFITLAAHELRGPITTIRGYLDMLEEQTEATATPEQKMLMDRLNVSAHRLASYVNNILNASRYDRRHLKLKLAETNVIDIASDIREDMDLRAKTVNRSVNWQIPNNLPTVAADRSSIGEVLSNLIDNAIKYSRDGGEVLVTARINGDFVEVAVVDHGIGIPSSVAEHIFSKFYRSHRSSGSVSGSGLGLYISRAIVESHGGQISFQSVEGQGSTFSFTMPIYATVRDQLAQNQDSNTSLITTNTAISNHGRMVE